VHEIAKEIAGFKYRWTPVKERVTEKTPYIRTGRCDSLGFGFALVDAVGYDRALDFRSRLVLVFGEGSFLSIRGYFLGPVSYDTEKESVPCPRFMRILKVDASFSYHQP
jgi:hypothetical protein